MIKPEVLKKYRQAAEELNRNFKTGPYKSLKPEHAFVEWYIQARFGSQQKARIFDGKKDGGIDAILEIGTTIYILQSKYELTAKVSTATRSDISAFEILSRKFKDASFEDEFLTWLSSVKPEFRALYEKAHRKALESPKSVRFIFITTKRSEFGDDDEYFEIEDIENIAALWYLYAEGFTPPTEYIDLALDNAWYTPSDNGRYKTYVGLADVKSFLRLMKDDENERLFAQNVRTNLRSKVNQYIQKTYEDEPDVFWLCNNGIYIVCKKVISSGNQYRLTFPSVINGSQTLHSIAESTKNHSCKILVRILEMDILGDPNLLSAVVRRTNTQNSMNVINLFAHDNVQLHVASYLDRYKVFYERREKEWKNERKILLSEYISVKTKDVAQWLSTKDDSIGLGTARNQLASLFDDGNYKKIFGGFGTNFQMPSYETLVLSVWSGLFIEHLMRHLPTRIRNFGKISRLMLVKTTFDAIQQSPSLKNAIADALKEHKIGRKHIPNSIQKIFREIISKTVQLQKKEQKSNPKVDYSNFFKRDDLTVDAYVKVCTPSLRSKLVRTLTKDINKIQ